MKYTSDCYKKGWTLSDEKLFRPYSPQINDDKKLSAEPYLSLALAPARVRCWSEMQPQCAEKPVGTAVVAIVCFCDASNP